MIARGDIWWAEIPDPAGSGPGFRRPVVVVSADSFNRSAIDTVTVVALTSNLRRQKDPGNVVLSDGETGLDRVSVANVTQIFALDRDLLDRRLGRLSARKVAELSEGLRLALDLA